MLVVVLTLLPAAVLLLLLLLVLVLVLVLVKTCRCAINPTPNRSHRGASALILSTLRGHTETTAVLLQVPAREGFRGSNPG